MTDHLGQVNNMGTYLGVSGAGTQTVGLGFEVRLQTYKDKTQQLSMMDLTGLQNGNLNTARSQLGGAGTQTTGLGFGGLLMGLFSIQMQLRNMMVLHGQQLYNVQLYSWVKVGAHKLQHCLEEDLHWF